MTPLAAQNVIDLAQLANEQWIDKAPGTVHDACHDLVLEACASVRFTPNIAVWADDLLTGQGLVVSGLGVLLASQLGVQVSVNSELVTHPIRPELIMRIYVAARESLMPQKIATDLLEELRAAATELTGAGPSNASREY